MVPNELGGQTLENAGEINAVMAALAANGQIDTADRLGSQVSGGVEKFQARYRGFNVNDPGARMMIQDDAEMGIYYQNSLELNPTDTAVAIVALREGAQPGSSIGEQNRTVAREMLRQFDGPIEKPKSKTRLSRIRAWLGRLTSPDFSA